MAARLDTPEGERLDVLVILVEAQAPGQSLLVECLNKPAWKIYWPRAAQGSITGTFRSAKCRTFRVASVACRASAMPAICVSRMSTGIGVRGVPSISLGRGSQTIEDG